MNTCCRPPLHGCAQTAAPLMTQRWALHSTGQSVLLMPMNSAGADVGFSSASFGTVALTSAFCAALAAAARSRPAFILALSSSLIGIRLLLRCHACDLLHQRIEFAACRHVAGHQAPNPAGILLQLVHAGLRAVLRCGIAGLPACMEG